MADVLINDKDIHQLRFSCDCGDAGHSLTCCLELSNDQPVALTFSLFMAGRTPFRFRLRQMWNLLRGKDGELADFGFRLSDTPELLKLLQRILINPNTAISGTTILSWNIGNQAQEEIHVN